MSTNGQSSSDDGIYAKFQSSIHNMKACMRQQFNHNAEEYSKFAPRILLLGPSGVGKSTLVNHVFGFGKEEQAKVRAGGRPCTQAFSDYGPFDGIPVVIVDSKGIERETANKQRDDIVEYVRKTNNDVKVENHVHVAWYMPSERWEESDTLYVQKMRHEDKVKVGIVLTKCDLRMEIDEETNLTALEVTKRAIKESVPGVPIVECAKPPPGSTYWVPEACPLGHNKVNFAINNRKGTWRCEAEVNDEECGKRGKERTGAFGYEELIGSTIEMVPELVRKSLLVAQVVDMTRKTMKQPK